MSATGIEAFFASLAAAWSGGEVTTIAEHFALPLMVVTAGLDRVRRGR